MEFVEKLVQLFVPHLGIFLLLRGLIELRLDIITRVSKTRNSSAQHGRDVVLFCWWCEIKFEIAKSFKPSINLRFRSSASAPVNETM